MWPTASHFASLSLGFLIWKTEVSLLPGLTGGLNEMAHVESSAQCLNKLLLSLLLSGACYIHSDGDKGSRR